MGFWFGMRNNDVGSRCRLNRGSKWNIWATIGFAMLFFAAVAPALSWPQFSGDSEDLVVQAVLEMRHGGPVWIPNLLGHPRVRKPPLTTWISAAAVSTSTLRDLSSTTPSIREAAYRRLAWEVRWPALLAASLLLLATGWLADSLGGPAHVVPAVLICGTSLLFVRFIRAATTDVHLALWVTLANACFASAVARKRLWLGCVGGGAALGLAIMTKGPVAIFQTLIPIGVILLARRWGGAGRSIANDRSDAGWRAPVFAGVVVALLIALPWPISAVLRTPGSLETWYTDMKGQRNDRVPRDPLYAYAVLLVDMLPWLPIFLGGVYIAARRLTRKPWIVPLRPEVELSTKALSYQPIHIAAVKARYRPPLRLGLLIAFLVVPIALLSFLHDRKERYLLPLAGPAAILAAHAAVRLKRAYPPRDPLAMLTWGLHWTLLGVFAVGFPIFGALRLRRLDDTPWYSPSLAAGAALCGGALIALGIIGQRRWRLSLIASGAMAMLLLFPLFVWGWSQSGEGLSEMKPIADRLHADFPGGRVIFYDPPPPDKPVTLDLDIYLDEPVMVTSNTPPSADYSVAAAIVVLRNAHDPEPGFPGWRIHFDMHSRKHHWYVLTPAR